jgi:RNA polymerase sigma-70 factor, ECF subfamily
MRQSDFVRDTERHRRELLAHCYRMVGSVHEAEDLVQETYLRAWRAYGAFEGRSSVRSWLYRIATNTCLTALEQRGRRALPSGLGGPSDDPYAAVEAAGPGIDWLQPLPDALVTSDADDPASIVATREGLRLALVASLQYLPPRQRAVLILRDVLAWPAADVAEMLDMSTAAVKSLLQRARARLAEVSPTADQVVEPPVAELRALLDQYMAAFENADAAALESLLREDASIEMVGARTWFSGRKTCVPYLDVQVLHAPDEYRMVATSANGQPAAFAYRRDDDGTYRSFGIAVLDGSAEGISSIVVFTDPGVVARFGFPAVDG